ncbi:hypothetical protein [Microbacterium sp. A93]|uniref:hypothetical protein n=1 Tax=Microbacterium sp. A93 TaxID=3450716 RepID=UPI003F43B1A8
MIRALFTIIWFLLSAWLLIWVGESLFGIDQQQSILPFHSSDPLTAPIIIGISWGLILTIAGAASAFGRRSTLRGDTEIGVGVIVDLVRGSMRVNDLPQFDIYVRVTAADGAEFISHMRRTLEPAEEAMLQVGMPLPVHYSVTDPDVVTLADMTDLVVRDAMLDWRIRRGLIDPRQVRARTSGIQVSASVLSVRPTGTRREGQSELALRVLVTPDGQSSWETDTTVFVYPDAISRLQVGSPVWAMYRREDPHTIAITIEQEVGR